MRKSKQRDLILKIIKNSYDHPSAYTIYEKCQKEIPNISLGTVYRNLNSLVDNLKIKRIKMPDNIDRYDRIDDFHAHFMCFKCKQLLDLKISNNLLQKEVNGNKIINYEISFQGICQKCLDKEGGEYGTKRK